jgi:hypothetical protein
MSNPTLRSLIPVCFAFAAVTTAHADNPPPIKPGLWQVHSEREVDGKAQPDISAHMQDLPPEVRQRMESMMKQRGVDMSGDDLKICLSKESLDAGRWQNMQGNCNITYSTRTNKNWKWHSVCTQPAAESDGEALFIDDKHYSIDTTMKINAMGTSNTTHMKINSKWVSADCGDIQPVGSQTLLPAK